MDKIKRVFRTLFIEGALQSKLSEIHKAELLLLRHDADCGYQYRGRIYSQIIDSVADLASYHGMTSSSIAVPFSKFFGASAHNNPLIFNRVFLRIALVAAVLSRTVGPDRALGYKRDASIRAWKQILDRVQPKVVIGIQPNRYLCAACRDVRIPVYDYQHGVIAPDHWWYGNLLKNDIPDDELPTGILCWDRTSATSLESWAPARGVRVHVLGNPWFKRFKKKMPHDHIVQEALGAGEVFDNHKPSILVSLQWGLDDAYYADTEFNGVICEALCRTINNTHQIYNWMLRLHPVQLHSAEGRETIDYLDREFGRLDGVEWEKSSRLPLPVLLTKTQLHITDMSTVVTEAAWHGVPSAILNPFLEQGERLESLFKDERASGIANCVAQREAEIEKWILDALELQHSIQEVEPEESILEFLRETVGFDDTI